MDRMALLLLLVVPRKRLVVLVVVLASCGDKGSERGARMRCALGREGIRGLLEKEWWWIWK